MPQNDKLLLKLKDQKFLSNPKCKDALDAVLSKAPTDIQKIREGFAAHQDFWAGVLDLDKDEVKDDPEFLTDDKKIEIIQGIAHSRAKLGLRTANSAVLQGIIAADKNGVRSKFANDTATKAMGGDQLATSLKDKDTSEEIITNTAVDDLQLEAQYQLLSKRIKAIQEDQQLDSEIVEKYFANLFEALVNGPDAKFQTALNSLNHPNNPPRAYPKFSSSIVGKMKIAEVGVRIKNEIALENFDKDIGAIYGSLKNNPDAIHENLNKKLDNPTELAAFTDWLPDPYKRIPQTEQEAKPFIAILGERYLIEQVIAQKDQDQLERIAKATDVKGLIAALGNATTDPYLTTAVHQGSVASLREAAAKRLLIERIQEITDEDTLKVLTDVRNASNLKSVLENYDTLNLNGNDKATIREALSSHEEALAAAHVRLSLLKSNDVAKLIEIIKESADPQVFARNFAARFPMSDELRANEENLLKDYFTNPSNVLQARRQALLSAAKAKFESPDITVDNFRNLLNELDKSHTLPTPFITSIYNNLGIEEEDVPEGIITQEDILGFNNPNSLGRKLAASAYVAYVAKLAANLDLSSDSKYNQLITRLNAIASNPNFYEQSLSETEKHDLATRLTAIIIKQNPATKANELLTLSTANSIQEFKDALTRLKIENHTWVNEKTIEFVQKAAVQGVISRQIESITGLNDKAYPALTNVINTLSLKHHKELLQPNFLDQLLDSRDANDIKARLNCKLDDAKKILGDFENISRIKSISNPAIAEQLLNMPRIPNLTAEQVNSINTKLQARATGTATFDASNLRFPPRQYDTQIDELFTFTHPASNLNASDKQAIQAALSTAQDDVREQSRVNHFLYKFNDNNQAKNSQLDKNNRAVVHFLQSLKKGNDVLQEGQIPAILDHFKNASSLANLHERIDKMRPRLDGTLVKSLKQELTPRRYDEFKQRFKKANLLQDIRQTEPDFKDLDKSVSEIKDLFSKISKGTSRIDLELEALSWLKSMQWLNPAFQASAAQYAHAMLPQMREVAQGCDTLVIQLQHQYDTVTRELANLPTAEDIANEISADQSKAEGPAKLSPNKNDAQEKRIKQIKAKAKELEELQLKISETLNRYKNVQRMLNGDPDGNSNPDENNEFLQKGALKVLEEAKDVKHSVRFLSYKSAYKDYPMSELKDHLGPNWKGSRNADSSSLTRVRANGKPLRYELVDKVADGHFREHTIGTGKDKGLFIEQRSDKDMATKREKDGSYSVNPSVSIVITQFPAKQADAAGNETAASQQARIKYGFAVATQLLSTLSGPPTADNPIFLEGIDSCSAEELPYIWTALMVIGKENPHMRFGKDAIKVDSCYFDPHDELNFIGRFSGTSHFKKVFEPNAKTYKNLLNQMIDYQDEKSNKYEEKKKVLGGIVKDIKDEFKDESSGNRLTRLFKTKFQSTIKESEEKNKAQEPQAKRMKLSP